MYIKLLSEAVLEEKGETVAAPARMYGGRKARRIPFQELYHIVGAAHGNVQEDCEDIDGGRLRGSDRRALRPIRRAAEKRGKSVQDRKTPRRGNLGGNDEDNPDRRYGQIRARKL